MNKELTDKVLDKIKNEGIAPAPRWRFLLKNYLVWTAAAVTLVVGVSAVPVIIHMLVTNDWDAYAYAGFSLPHFILVTLPYFWLVFLALCLVLGYYNLKHTKSGYRYGTIYVMLVSVAVSLLLGSALYGAGLGRAIDEQFAQNIPLYERFARPRHLIWMQNNHGLLAGKIMTITDDTHFQLKDLRNRQWEVVYFALASTTTEATADTGQPQQWFAPGVRIRAIGQRVDADTFNAHLLAPFDPFKGDWVRSVNFPPPPHWQMMR